MKYKFIIKTKPVFKKESGDERANSTNFKLQ